MSGGAVHYPTADQVAHAIVAACRMFGEDPVAVAMGLKGSSGRIYAFAALSDCFPSVPAVRVAAMLGVREAGRATFAANCRFSRQRLGWHADRLSAVVVAVTRSAPSAAAAFAGRLEKDDEKAAHFKQPSTFELLAGAAEKLGIAVIRSSDAPARGARRIIDRRPTGDVAPSLMGDPPPGRSALDRAKPE